MVQIVVLPDLQPDLVFSEEYSGETGKIIELTNTRHIHKITFFFNISDHILERFIKGLFILAVRPRWVKHALLAQKSDDIHQKYSDNGNFILFFII